MICPHCTWPPPPRSAPAPRPAELPALPTESVRQSWRRESTRQVLGALALSSAVLFLVASPVEAPLAGPRVLSVSTESSMSSPLLSRLQVAAPEPERRHPLSVGRRGELPVWYHPLAIQGRLLPERPSRQFGAPRPGDRPEECGAGHCGVDLGGPPGTVIHAVRPGRVTRIVRDPDRPSGRYVRLEHESGFSSSYMHLGRIHPELVVGLEVAAGEPLGTLGSSGIDHSPPHLHLAVSRLEGERQRFVDPAPMLREAIVLESPAPFPDEVDPGVD